MLFNNGLYRMSDRQKRGILLGVLLLLAWPLRVLGQGMAVPRRQPRASPLTKSDRPLPKVWFEDVATEAGLQFRHVAGDPLRKLYLLEATGSGAAIFDFDNDGLADIFLVNGAKWRYDAGEPRPTNRLFRNRGGLKFEDVTTKARLVHTGWGQGVCVGDYDNDGLDDLFVTYYGPNILYRNQGDGTFRNVTATAGLPEDGTRWGTGCSFLDYDRDGELDLAVANYLHFDPEHSPKPGDNDLCMYKGLPVVCGPRGLLGETNTLYHNVGNGAFVDVSEESGFTGPSGYYCFSVLSGDFDNDSWPDVYIACDSTPSILFRNNRDGTFTDIGISSGTAFNQDGLEQAGMGATTTDFNQDGLLDIVKTNFAEDTPTLYQNNGERFFTDVTYRGGLGVNTQFVGWGVGFVDIDHDGWKDIVIVNGHIYPSIERLNLEISYKQEKNIYWNLRNGAFLDISAQTGPGILDRYSARGAAFGDLNNDGAIEVVVNNLDNRPSLLVNHGEQQNWLLVKLLGTKSNRNGIGARITVEAGSLKQIAEVRSGGSYMSHSETRLHFGLASATKVDNIQVRWPSGLTQSFNGSKVNREVLLQEGQGLPLTPAMPSRSANQPLSLK